MVEPFLRTWLLFTSYEASVWRLLWQALFLSLPKVTFDYLRMVLNNSSNSVCYAPAEQRGVAQYLGRERDGFPKEKIT